jgi:hypothetical protein
MPFRGELYANIAKDFKEWLQTSNAGDFVTDFALRFLNLAQQDLNIYRPWKGLTKKKQTLSLTSKVGTYPTDCAKIVRCFDDSDGDGEPDNFYYENLDYYISPTFTKAAGFSATITFYSSPSSTAYLDYILILPDFVADDTGKSFFPASLLLKKAQMLYLEQDGRIGTEEYKMIFNSYNNDIIDFTQNEVENLDMRMESKDDHGRKVAVESYSLSGGADETMDSRYDRDVDLR